MENQILLNNGTIIKYTEWAALNNLENGKLSKNLTCAEIEDSQEGYFLMSEKMIEIFQAIRTAYGKPIQINSGYRTNEHQQKLIDQYKGTDRQGMAADISPHCRGFAMDIQPGQRYWTVYDLIKVIKSVRDSKYPYLRMGYKKYIKVGMMFVHIDCAPFYYGPEGSLKFEEGIPASWLKAGLEW